MKLSLFGLLCLVMLIGCSRSEDFYRTKNLLAAEKVNVMEVDYSNNYGLQNIVDEFEQKSGSKKVDILWVVDNSRSMGNEQKALARNFGAFINDFIVRDVDFKMAVTVTDPEPHWKGYMIKNNPELLTAKSAKENQAKFIEDFKSTIEVGIIGSGNEQGLNAIEGFIERYSQTFFRKDAYLIVVIVSDEEDSSPKKVQEYVEQLQALKENQGMVKVYSIVDTRDLKPDPTLRMKYGFARYKEMSESTSGLVVDINQDFHESLTEIGKSVLDLLDNFPLKAKPLNQSLRVYVNEELSLETAYSVESSGHILKFKPDSIPVSGSRIRAEYQIKIKKIN